jgi:hypothetical protein
LLENIKEYLNVEKRFDCLIENLLERRADNWIDSVLVEEGPKTMSEIYLSFTKRNQAAEEQSKKPEAYVKPVYVVIDFDLEI